MNTLSTSTVLDQAYWKKAFQGDGICRARNQRWQVTLAFLMIAGCYWLLRHEISIKWFVTFMAGLALVGWPIWRWSQSFNETYFDKQASKHPLLGKRASWTINSTNVELKIEDQTVVEPWSQHSKSFALSDGVLVPIAGVIQCLPKNAFESESDYNRFLNLIAAKTKHSVIN